MNNNYYDGLKDGISVGLGYFSVSFSFGILCIANGLSSLQATLFSGLTLTSAGQFAGLDAIASSLNIVTIIIAQIIINSRYFLMSLSLSQRLEDMGTFKRMIVAFFNTDEIFAIAIGKEGKLTLSYMLGLLTLPWLGWTSGTLCGSLMGSVLPLSITSCLSISLYAMFIAIVVPQFKENKNIRYVVYLSIALSLIVNNISFLKDYYIILCTILASGIAAVLLPIKEEQAV